MPQNGPDNVDTQYLDKRTRQQNAEVDRLVQQRLAQPDPAKPAPPPPPTTEQVIDELPSPAFRGSFGIDSELLPLRMAGNEGGLGHVAENTIGTGMLSGIEKEAVDTLSSVPNLLLIAGTGGLGTIPAIAKVGGTRLLSAYFGLEMGKTLWSRYQEYYKATQEEGGLGPRSRELLGRMTVLAAFATKAGEHALTEAKPGMGGKPLADVKSPLEVPNENVEAVLRVAKSKSSAEPPAGTPPPAATPEAGAAPPNMGEARVNLARIDNTQAVKDTIETVNRMNAERMSGDRATRSHAESIAKSRSLGMTVEKALALEPGKVEEGQTLAVRDLRDRAGEYARTLADKFMEGDADAGMRLKGAFTVLMDVEAKREALSRVSARELETGKIPSDSARSAEDLVELAQHFGSTVDADPLTLAQMITTLPKSEVPTFASKVLQGVRNGQDMLYEAWMNGLLSGPQTHIVNFMGNFFMLGDAIAERAMAAQIGKVTGGNGVQTGEASAMFYALTKNWGEALRMAGRTLRAKPGSEMYDFGKVEMSEPAIQSGKFGVEGTGIGRAIDLLGAFVRLPGKGLAASDVFFKTLNYKMEVSAQALRQGIAEGLSGEALQQRVAAIEADPPPAMQAAAEHFALLQTFQEQLGPVGKGVAQIADNLPLGRVILPFIRTPGNIVKWAAQRTPGLAQLSYKNWSDIAAGGPRRDLALARMSAGAVTAATMATLAANGQITGGGPRDPNLKRQLRDTGWQPYSVKVGDQYYAYSRLDPLGMLIGTVADFTEISGQIPKERAEELTTAIVLSLSQNMVSKTYMQGIANVVEAIESPDRSGKKMAESFVGSFVPGLVRTTERSVDPTLRETNSLLDEIRTGVPGWSDELPPTRNIFGEPILLGGGWGPDIISPIYVSQNKKDEVADEIARVGVRLDMPSKTLFGVSPPDLRMSPERATEGVDLNPQQYDLLVRLAGNELKGPDGLGMKDKLQSIFHSPDYQQQTDGPDGGKALMIRTVVQSYRAAARAQLVGADPQLQRAQEDVQRKRVRLLTPQPTTPLRPPARANIGIAP